MNKIGIIGSGNVGQNLGSGFIKLGYKVKIGSREPGKLNDWVKKSGDNASSGSFEEVAKFGEIIVVCTKHDGTENAINLARKINFKDKIIIDVTNPLLFENENSLPKLAVGYPESAGSKLQEILSGSKVVKAFNIVTANYMTNAKLKQGTPDMFICGNDKEAKKIVSEIARKWSWEVTDIGGIEQAYLLESLAMLWIRYGFLNNHWTHAFKLLKE